MKSRDGKHSSPLSQSFVTGAIVEFVSSRTVRIFTDAGERFSLRTQDCPVMVPGDRVSGRIGRYKGIRNLKPSSLSIAPCKSCQVVLQSNRTNLRGTASQTLVPVSFELSGHIESANKVPQLGHGQYVLATLSRTKTRSPSSTVWTVTNVDRILNGACEVAASVALSRFGVRDLWFDQVKSETTAMIEQSSRFELNSRRDLRHLPFVTIDPASARDHDDAIFCEKLQSGDHRLWVAIADVAHYVKPASALDSTAKFRGASIYFPCMSVPMLPPELSNQICSLKPDVDRLVVACEMVVNPDGIVVFYEFCEGIIRSRARMNYAEIDDANAKDTWSPDVVDNLRCLSELNQVFLSARNTRGALSLDLPETSFQFDDDEQVDAIVKAQSRQSHSMIEEAMLAANTCAAQFISEHYPKAAMYRIHENPSRSDLDQLNELLDGLGVSSKMDTSATVADYQTISERLKERFPTIYPVYQAHILRSLATAVYSEKMQPHFALNYRRYTHFTSPIRRYPDLIVHRLIKDVLNSTKRQPDQIELSALAKQSSRTERRAESCAREAESWLKAEFMEQYIGDRFDGIIADIRKFGVFVRLNSPYVDGMVPVSELGNEYFEYDESWRRLTGSVTGRSFRIGQKLQVKVVDVNRELGFINFEPV